MTAGVVSCFYCDTNMNNLETPPTMPRKKKKQQQQPRESQRVQLSVGTIIRSHWRVVGKLGSGNCGDVYEGMWSVEC